MRPPVIVRQAILVASLSPSVSRSTGLERSRPGEMTEKLLEQLILQAPAVGVLLYLLFRLDQRIGELIRVIVGLAETDQEEKAKRRLENLLPPKR